MTQHFSRHVEGWPVVRMAGLIRSRALVRFKRTWKRVSLVPEIETHDLTRCFGEFTAVDNVNVGVQRGEIYGLLGPNGAGKSTIIRMLSTLLMPSYGSATVAGFDVRSEANDVKKRIGLVSEKLILYTRLTATQNLLFFGKLYKVDSSTLKKRIDELLELVKLTQFKDKAIGSYSSGMRQRVNIIRALLHDPEIIFLDEPTTGLDPQSTRFIWDLVKRLKSRGRTIILTTHMMEEADELSDRVCIIDHGKVMADDTSRALKDKFQTESMLDVFLNVTGRELRDSTSQHLSMRGMMAEA
jgi:ABC-2 type transport system ATP-binding protein